VHRHTIPPAIPLAALADKYLPSPASAGADTLKAAKQNLPLFLKALRHQIASYHNRVAVIADMRKTFGLDVKRGRDKGKGKELVIGDITAADAEARQIRFEWVDGRIGRAVIDPQGNMVKGVVIGEEGRDKETERLMMGGDKRIEGLANRLTK
jgi:central kinetochore subunit Mal2/MCM21